MLPLLLHLLPLNSTLWLNMLPDRRHAYPFKASSTVAFSWKCRTIQCWANLSFLWFLRCPPFPQVPWFPYCCFGFHWFSGFPLVPVVSWVSTGSYGPLWFSGFHLVPVISLVHFGCYSFILFLGYLGFLLASGLPTGSCSPCFARFPLLPIVFWGFFSDSWGSPWFLGFLQVSVVCWVSCSSCGSFWLPWVPFLFLGFPLVLVIPVVPVVPAVPAGSCGFLGFLLVQFPTFLLAPVVSWVLSGSCVFF